MVRLRCQSRSQQPPSVRISRDSPGNAGSGSVGCIRADCDGRTTMSEALRFNIVIFVAFTERETHICVVYVLALGSSDVEYDSRSSFLVLLLSLSVRISCFLFPRCTTHSVDVTYSKEIFGSNLGLNNTLYIYN